MNFRNLNREGPSFNIEAGLCFDKNKFIAGIDEAGRGALAGPLSVGLVIFHPDFYYNIPDFFYKIKDSKLLTHQKRKDVAEIIKEKAYYINSVLIDEKIIDEININEATKLAIRKLIEQVPYKMQHVLMDGNLKIESDIPVKSIVKGDNLSFSIAAASIIAKTTRDRLMVEYHKIYNNYAFDKHKGYGTKLHRELILKHGPSPIHRKSYEPLRSMLHEDKK